jgi:2-(3-amino-3-carboxypropyl)histidine synthase
MEEKSIPTYYDLELENLAKKINDKGYKLIVLQFPDGLKYYSKQIIDFLREKTKAEYFSYFGSCYGACDIPLHLKELKFDLCVQWGHAVYIKKKEMW